jgi:hypothetical protein
VAWFDSTFHDVDMGFMEPPSSLYLTHTSFFPPLIPYCHCAAAPNYDENPHVYNPNPLTILIVVL